MCGPTIIKLEPEDFIDLIIGKDLKIIRCTLKKSWVRAFTVHTYFAPDLPITYYTKSREELTELHIDFIAKRIIMGFAGAIQ